MVRRIQHTAGVGSIATAKSGSSGGPKIVFTAIGGKASGASFSIAIDNAQIRKGDLALFFLIEASQSSSISFLPDFKQVLEWANSPYKHHMFARRLDGTETGVAITNNGTSSSAVVIVLRACAGLSVASAAKPGLVTNVEAVGARPGGIAEADGVYLFVVGNLSSNVAIATPPSGMDQLANFATYERRVAVYAKSFRKGETIGDKNATTSAGNLVGWSGLMI